MFIIIIIIIIIMLPPGAPRLRPPQPDAGEHRGPEPAADQGGAINIIVCYVL